MAIRPTIFDLSLSFFDSGLDIGFAAFVRVGQHSEGTTKRWKEETPRMFPAPPMPKLLFLSSSAVPSVEDILILPTSVDSLAESSINVRSLC